MQRRFFGTDGVRGPVGGPLMNPGFVYQLGRAAGERFSRSLPGGATPRAVLGRDTRGSGPSLAAALGAGLRDAGWQVDDLGILPTAAVAGWVRHSGATLGAMITASHNPATDNGVKFFDAGGYKLPDAIELEIEALVPEFVSPPTLPTAPEHTRPEALQHYLEQLGEVLAQGALTGWTVVLDTAHGAGYHAAPSMLRWLDASFVQLGGAPTGENINAGGGSEYPGALATAVRAHQARLGMAFDGDADRLVLVDELGDLVDGDELLALVALHLLQQGELPGGVLVATVMSNLGLDAALTAAGGRVVRAAVGDRYVLQAMRDHGAGFGGENSGHLIFARHSTTGDGLLAALQVLSLMLASGRPLSELRRSVTLFPQAKANVPVKAKPALESVPGFLERVAAIEAAIAGGGRVLVRYSGTEAKIRLLAEAPTPAAAQGALAELKALVAATLA